jgi:hypothetical protein
MSSSHNKQGTLSSFFSKKEAGKKTPSPTATTTTKPATPSPDKQSSTSTASTSSSSRQQQQQHAIDALSLRQQGNKATIQKLCTALEDATAKSDAVVLELRSSLRDIKQKKKKIVCNSHCNKDETNKEPMMDEQYPVLLDNTSTFDDEDDIPDCVIPTVDSFQSLSSPVSSITWDGGVLKILSGLQFLSPTLEQELLHGQRSSNHDKKMQDERPI